MFELFGQMMSDPEGMQNAMTGLSDFGQIIRDMRLLLAMLVIQNEARRDELGLTKTLTPDARAWIMSLQTGQTLSVDPEASVEPS